MKWQTRDIVTTPGGVAHLYAVWKSQSSYSVCFHRNDGSSDKVTMTQVILRDNEERLAWMDSEIGWTSFSGAFKGWSESADSRTVKYANGAKVKNLAMNGGTRHLYAVWGVADSVYTVRFHKNDGTGTTCDQMFTVGQAQELLWTGSQLSWIRPGYEFVGWVPWNPDTKSRLCKYVNGQLRAQHRPAEAGS